MLDEISDASCDDTHGADKAMEADTLMANDPLISSQAWLDVGPEKAKRQEKMRYCPVARQSKPRQQMIRFVVAPTGQVIPDVKSCLPGRGIWLSCQHRAITVAIKRRLFLRSFRNNVLVDPMLPHHVEDLLVKSCLEKLSLARRAGQGVGGFEKVAKTAKKTLPALRLLAGDAADNSAEKMQAILPTVPVYMLLKKDELGQAFGRPELVHVIVTQGGLAEKLKLDLERLQIFRQ